MNIYFNRFQRVKCLHDNTATKQLASGQIKIKAVINKYFSTNHKRTHIHTHTITFCIEEVR